VAGAVEELGAVTDSGAQHANPVMVGVFGQLEFGVEGVG
jgi:hypothetical protein